MKRKREDEERIEKERIKRENGDRIEKEWMERG